jgi:predicted GNAT superfamily acetyltransferase
MIDSITYRMIIDIKDLNEVVSLQAEIWGQDVVSPQPQLVASIHHGGVVIGAFLEEKLVGFCYGFAGFKNGENYLISHMTGIRKQYQNLGIGFQLKLKQREWAITYGYRKIVWTYDPLEVRNGFFNLCKLGATARTYYPSYYGEMPDKLNKGLPTDRLLVEWDIRSNRVQKSISGMVVTETVPKMETIFSNQGECPVIKDSIIDRNLEGYLVAVPTNIQELKQINPEASLAWRLALRDVLTEAFSKGFIVTGVLKVANSTVQFYVLENKQLEDIYE